jgi:replication initiation and membrane attachment protein
MILRNDGKITNNFAERIASHWSNKKVSTAKVAMELSRTEHDQYMKWLNEGKKKPAGRKPIREEKVPEWFYKKDDTEQKEPAKEADPAIDEQRRQLMEKLDAMRNGVK